MESKPKKVQCQATEIYLEETRVIEITYTKIAGRICYINHWDWVLQKEPHLKDKNENYRRAISSTNKLIMRGLSKGVL